MYVYAAGLINKKLYSAMSKTALRQYTYTAFLSKRQPLMKEAANASPNQISQVLFPEISPSVSFSFSSSQTFPLLYRLAFASGRLPP